MSRDAAHYPAVTRTPTLRTSRQSTLWLTEQSPQATQGLAEQDGIQTHSQTARHRYRSSMRVVASNLRKEVRILHTDGGSSQRDHSGYGAGLQHNSPWPAATSGGRAQGLHPPDSWCEMRDGATARLCTDPPPQYLEQTARSWSPPPGSPHSKMLSSAQCSLLSSLYPSVEREGLQTQVP